MSNIRNNIPNPHFSFSDNYFILLLLGLSLNRHVSFWGRTMHFSTSDQSYAGRVFNPMVLVSDGNSSIRAHVRRKLCYSTCLRHLNRSRVVTFWTFLSEKTYFTSCVRNMLWVTIWYKYHGLSHRSLLYFGSLAMYLGFGLRFSSSLKALLKHVKNT